jgi:anti-sigma factor RsiW
MRDDEPDGGRRDMRAGGVDLTCRDVAEFLAAYLDGELGAERRAPFEAHLAECPDCRTYLRQYEATIRLARETCGGDDPIAAGIPEELVDAILAATGKTARRRRS